MSDSPQRLVWLAKTGDKEAFSELVSLFESKVYRAAFGLTGNEHDAKDLSQETFVRAFRGIAKFREKSSFFTWLYRILLNVFKSWVKSRGEKVELPENRGQTTERERVRRETASRDNPAGREDVDRVYKAIYSLPPEQKMAIVLHALESMRYCEIATAMNCSIGTVKSRIHAARVALKRALLRENP